MLDGAYVDLKQLKYFLEVIDRGGFTKASESLGIAQSAISIAVKKLEEDINIPLLDRSQRKLTLTSEGAAFVKGARNILEQVDSLYREMDEFKALVQGELKIGIPGMLATHYFPSKISAFREHYPQLKISVFSEGAKKLETMLCQGFLDAAIIADESLPEELTWQPLLTDEIVACVGRGHHLAGRNSVSLSELANETLFLFREGNYQRAVLSKAFEDLGRQPNIAFETNLTSLLKTMTSTDGGVCTLLRMAVDTPGLIAIPIEPTLHVNAGIAWRKGSYVPLATKAFIDYLIEDREVEIEKGQ